MENDLGYQEAPRSGEEGKKDSGEDFPVGLVIGIIIAVVFLAEILGIRYIFNGLF